MKLFEVSTKGLGTVYVVAGSFDKAAEAVKKIGHNYSRVLVSEEDSIESIRPMTEEVIKIHTFSKPKYRVDAGHSLIIAE